MQIQSPRGWSARVEVPVSHARPGLPRTDEGQFNYLRRINREARRIGDWRTLLDSEHLPDLVGRSEMFEGVLRAPPRGAQDFSTLGQRLGVEVGMPQTGKKVRELIELRKQHAAEDGPEDVRGEEIGRRGRHKTHLLCAAS